jgi:UPF0042 nucleotide-binding protein
MSGNTYQQQFEYGDGNDPITGGKPFEIIVISFGYKKEPPPNAHLTLDVRFLKNPYWVEQLRPLTGRDQPVQDYVMSQKPARDLLAALVEMLETTLPLMVSSNHDRYSIALGCTGGQHRSATLAEALSKELKNIFPTFKVSTYHRELEKLHSETMIHSERELSHDIGARLHHDPQMKGSDR